MRKRDLATFGYREIEHAGFSWLANEEGVRFLVNVNDWSPGRLATKTGWNCRKKRDHTVYVARNHDGTSYLIKDYLRGKNRKYFFGGEANRAKTEFSKTLVAYRNDIQTVLPLAVGEWKEDRQRGLIIYPFLDKAIALERVYEDGNLSRLAIRERHDLEKAVGKLLRRMSDAGAYPVDGHLDHFLALRADTGKISVYYIDLERVGFSSFTQRRFMRRKLMKTLGRLLARLEWLRVSDGRINRATMMRIGHAFFAKEGLRKLDKKLCRVVIKAARRYWYRREFHKRGPYRLRSFEPSE